MLISSAIDSKLQQMFLTKHYNKRQNAVNILFGVSSTAEKFNVNLEFSCDKGVSFY